MKDGQNSPRKEGVSFMSDIIMLLTLVMIYKIISYENRK